MTGFDLKAHFIRLCSRIMEENPRTVRLCGGLYINPRVEVVPGAVSLQGHTVDGRDIFFTIWGGTPHMVECLGIREDGEGLHSTLTPTSREELNSWVHTQLFT